MLTGPSFVDSTNIDTILPFAQKTPAEPSAGAACAAAPATDRSDSS